MNTLYLDSKLDDNARRQELYDGQLFVYSPRKSARLLCEFAQELIADAFGTVDARKAHEQLSMEECAAILTELKPKFIHHPKSKEHIRNLLVELGCDPEKTYFDVPRMRSAFPTDYLTSGIAYAFHPHRDTWYSAPLCQLNWWMPIFDINPNNCLAFHSLYWDRPVRNGSRNYNYYEWNAVNRKNAAQHIKSDTRVQPHAEEPLQLDPQTRIVCDVGGIIIFSGAHLHSTVPNTSGTARFSIDFRTVHVGDVWERRGAPNLDSECTGTTMRDYLRVTDLARLPEDAVALYDDGTATRGEVIYQGTSVGAQSA